MIKSKNTNKPTKTATKPAAKTATKPADKATAKLAVKAAPKPVVKPPAKPTANLPAKDTDADTDMVHDGKSSISAIKQKKSASQTIMDQRVEKLEKYRTEHNLDQLTQRMIMMNVGCSFKVAALLQAKLAALKGEQVTIEAIVSDAFVDSVKALIISNVEAYRDSVDDKLRLIADTEKALDMALKLFHKIFKSQER